ncbi:MLO-LIKE PROTEIN 1 [Salix koriyanagi]|uniref:MLO-LIKE PROTEIN 1 n=1 Tax=Salix koriyanagi TaxID=2511006 RepID=A0A9Q0UP04_9ROSI|nr:MLO-LIKE PROTEIN 1 [Salix koriyanagi]
MLDAFSDNFSSVSRSDYLTLHNGFITVHLAPGSKFNFQKYIKRSLEDDFKLVVGVGPVLWACFIIFLLLNVNGLQALFWASIIPVIYSFGLKSCFHDNFDLVIAKVALGVGALILCSYITLPLYALVTQVPSTFSGIFKSLQVKLFCWNEHDQVKSYRRKFQHQMDHLFLKQAFDQPTNYLLITRNDDGFAYEEISLRRANIQGSEEVAHACEEEACERRKDSYSDAGKYESDLEAEALSPTTTTTSFIVRVDDDDDVPVTIVRVDDDHDVVVPVTVTEVDAPHHERRNKK